MGSEADSDGLLDASEILDLKLDAGISIGVFEVSGDRLALAINALALPERLAVPTRGRPQAVRGGEDRHFYVFRRDRPGE